MTGVVSGLRLALLVAGAVGGALWAPTATSAADKPNVLIIVTDDQRQGMVAMPFVSKAFGEHGTYFPNAYVDTPLCCPSRVSIMTGLYPHNHGVLANTDHPELGVHNFVAFDDSRSLQHVLHDAGYRTGFVGKFLNDWPMTQPVPSFDSWALVGRGNYLRTRVGAGTMADGLTETVTVQRYNTDVVRRRALKFLVEQRGSTQPFYLYVAPNAPHTPYVPEERYAADSFAWNGNPATRESDLSDKPPWVQESPYSFEEGRQIRVNQFRMLESVDDMVQDIFAELREQKQLENTLVVFMSDNGYMWSEHGLLHKAVPYLQAVHVPFYLRWGNGPLAPGTDGRAASNVDVMPTVLEAVGLPATGMDGRSLLQSWGRDRLYTEHWCNKDDCLFWSAEETAGWHYVEYRDGPSPDASVIYRELYDLRNDPWELQNLLGDGITSNDPDYSALANLLAADRVCRGGGCP